MSHGLKIAILMVILANLFIPSTIAIAEDNLSIDVPLATELSLQKLKHQRLYNSKF